MNEYTPNFNWGGLVCGAFRLIAFGAIVLGYHLDGEIGSFLTFVGIILVLVGWDIGRKVGE